MKISSYGIIARYRVTLVLACSIIALLLVAGCADIAAKQKVGDFGTAFGASIEEQGAITWFINTYGDPRTNNDKPPRFIEPMITSAIDKNNLPGNKVTTFPVDDGSVYFFVIYDNFQKGDPITVSWTYLENGKQVSTVEQKAGGDFGRFIVEFQKPDSGWGKGNQEITVSGNGTSAKVDFAIGDSLQTTPLPYTAGQGSTSTTTAVTTGSGVVNSNSIAITPTTITLDPGQKTKFTATVTGTSNTGVTWSATGGTIDTAGNYAAPNGAGSYQVTATSVADPTRHATATVVVNSDGIAIYPASITLDPGQKTKFTATVTGTSNTGVTWSATGGTIDTGGNYVAPNGAGSYQVTATSVADPGKRAVAAVMVNNGAPGATVTTTTTSSSSTTIVTCPNNYIVCDGQCVSADSNSNCGGCGVTCSGTYNCQLGYCVCDGGFCWGSNGQEGPSTTTAVTTATTVVTTTSASAGLSCSSGEDLCGGKCVSLNTDSKNCGQCDNTCPSGQHCLQGSCQMSGSGKGQSNT